MSYSPSRPPGRTIRDRDDITGRPNVRRSRARDRPDASGTGYPDELWVSSIGQSDAWVSLGLITEGEPFGGGVEATIPSGTDGTVAEWIVPQQRQAEIDELAVDIPAGATATVRFAGLSYGPFSGEESITIPFDGAALIGGSLIVIQASAGSEADATVKAQLTARLY